MSRLHEVTDDDLVRLHDLADALPENLASVVQREVERERGARSIDAATSAAKAEDAREDRQRWAQFMVGQLSCSAVTSIENAARGADVALEEYRKRFPRRTP